MIRLNDIIKVQRKDYIEEEKDRTLVFKIKIENITGKFRWRDIR